MSFYPIPKLSFGNDKLARPKRQISYMTKTKLPTKAKSISHKCSQCTRNDAKRYNISKKEVRWLCPVHFAMFSRIADEKPHFVKASHLK